MTKGKKKEKENKEGKRLWEVKKGKRKLKKGETRDVLIIESETNIRRVKKKDKVERKR